MVSSTSNQRCWANGLGGPLALRQSREGHWLRTLIVPNDPLQNGDEVRDRGRVVRVNVAIADAKQIEELEVPGDIRELPIWHPDAIEETLLLLFL